MSKRKQVCYDFKQSYAVIEILVLRLENIEMVRLQHLRRMTNKKYFLCHKT
jgi:hypothetical protein